MLYDGAIILWNSRLFYEEMVTLAGCLRKEEKRSKLAGGKNEGKMVTLEACLKWGFVLRYEGETKRMYLTVVTMDSLKVN